MGWTMWMYVSYRGHEWVEYADSEGSATGKRLCQIKLRIRIVVVVLIEELHVAVVHEF